MKSLLTAIFVFSLASLILAQDPNKNWFQVYGFAMTDIGYNSIKLTLIGSMLLDQQNFQQ